MTHVRVPEWLDLNRVARTKPAAGWECNGRCYSTGPEQFFPFGFQLPDRDIARLCGGCPVLYDCLATALAQRETVDHGIWGHTTERQRRSIRRRLRQDAARVSSENANGAGDAENVPTPASTLYRRASA